MALTVQLDLYRNEIARLQDLLNQTKLRLALAQEQIETQQGQIKAQQDHIYDLRLAVEKT